MHIKASPYPDNHKPPRVSVNMKYSESASISRSFYDACYYELGSFSKEHLDKIRKRGEEIHLYVRFTKKTNMNIYLYIGNSRKNATGSMIEGNDKVALNKNYTIAVEKGFLIVAYPKEDLDADFEFEYWVASYDTGVFNRMAVHDFRGTAGRTAYVMMWTMIAVFILFVCCIFNLCIWYHCCKDKTSKPNEIYDVEGTIGT